MFCRLSDSFYRVAFLVLVRCGGLYWVFSSFVGAGYGAFCLRSLVLKAVSSSLGSGKFCFPVFVCGCSPFHFFSFIFYPLRVDRMRLWSSLFLLRSSGGPQVILSWDLVGCYGTLVSSVSEPVVLAFGHITLSTLLLICFAKFCSIGSSQYLDGCPPGYTSSCWLSLCGLLEEKLVLSCSPPLAVSGFPAFSKTVAACGNFLVVSSTVLLPVGVCLLLFFAAFFFFRCECLLGSWWYSFFRSLACFHSLSAALWLPLGTFVLCLSSFPSWLFLNNAVSYFLSGTGTVGLLCFSLTCLSCSRSFVSCFQRYWLFFKGL